MGLEVAIAPLKTLAFLCILAHSAFQWPPGMIQFPAGGGLPATSSFQVLLAMMGTPPFQPHQRGDYEIDSTQGGLQERLGTSPLPGGQGPQAAQESPL